MPPAPAGAGRPCPDWPTLLDFNAGRLSPVAREGVETHVRGCAECESVLSELAEESAEGDSFPDQVLAYLRGRGPTPDPDEAGYRAMMEAARAARATVTADGENETAMFGAPGDTPADLRIGPYEVLGLIGQGGMGVVYKARHEVIRHVVALKQVRAGASARADVRTRFRTEAEAIGRLGHPHVVRIYDFGDAEEGPYYTMELAGGGSLAARLEAGPFPLREAAELVRTVAVAVEAAHAKNVLHRDLKPSNILLTADGTPKVADFGLARLLDAPDGRLTSADAVLGTPAYMAPEQAAGLTAEVDKPVDIWALGAILYECLTGRPPYRGKTKLETLRKASEGNPVRPSVLRSDLPPDLEAVCLKAMDRDPARRYGSAQALADDLGRWLAADPDEPTKARPESRLERLVAAVRPHVRVISVGVLLVACGLLGVVAPYSRSPAEEMAAAKKKLDAKLVAAKPGEAIELLGADGTQTYFRVRYGDERTKVSVAADGTFTVSSWTECLVELTPDPRHDFYQFGVSVCHQTSDLGGEAGLYFSHYTCPSPGEREGHWFGGMTFNDVRRPEDVAAAAPPQANDKLRPPDEALVRIKFKARGDQAVGGPWAGATGLCTGAPFTPRGIAADTWRDLALIVTPTRVEGFRDGKEIGSVSAEEVGKAVLWLRDSIASRRPHPAWSGCDPSYNTRGGMGLLVYRGTASFRAAKLTVRERNL